MDVSDGNTMMIEFEDHSEQNQKALLEYLGRLEPNSSRLTCPYCGAVNLFPWGPERDGIYLLEVRAGC
jgi:hypothetical protein